MKITHLHLENFKSFSKIDMEDIGDLVVLIGTNSSGKTNLIDALSVFFNELTPEISRGLGSIPEYTWFDRNTSSPIILDLTLELDDSDVKAIFPEETRNILKANGNTVRLVREINGQPTAANLVTSLLEINDHHILPATKKEPPEPDELSPELAGKLLTNLTTHLKGRFISIPAARDTTGNYQGFGARQPIINSVVMGELRNLAQTGTREARKRWQKLEDMVRGASPHVVDMRVLDGDFTIREEDSDTPFPINWVGGGYQGILMLVYQFIKAPDAIFGIDEPELHLHPALARRFFDILKDIAKDQQIFIASHSPIFVDRSDLSNVWIVKKTEDSSDVTQLQVIEDLSNINAELGVRPSDIFYSDIVVFVEGPSDRVVFPIISRKLGLPLTASEISFIPTYGKSQGKYHIQTFIESTKAANIPFFMILDKGAAKDVKEFIKSGVLKQDDNLFLLKDGDLEDYYPREKLIDSVCSHYGIEITEQEKEKLKTGSAVKAIETLLEQKKKEVPRGWKIIIGEIVANLMSEDEINEEWKRIIERISRKAGLTEI